MGRAQDWTEQDQLDYLRWEAEFRRSGKDRIFNQYIAFRRLYLAGARVWDELKKALYPKLERLLPHG